MYNNYVPSKGAAKDPYSYDIKKKPSKQVRKPVAQNFVPKRFGMSVDPPMLILEYLVPDTGKLYHHKMRLQSKMEQTLNRDELLKYLKNKHHLYFTNANPKIKDAQIEKLLDKLLQHYELDESEQGSVQAKVPPPQNKKPQELLQKKPEVVKGFDFLDYGKDEEDEDDEYGQEQWDLDMDENADIV